MLLNVSQGYGERQGEIGLLPCHSYNFARRFVLIKFLSILFGAAILLAAFSACSPDSFVAQNATTETPTRRAPRPTFTPKPRATATPEEVEPTEEPTETNEPEQVEPTEEPTAEPPTQAPTKKPAPAKPTTPPQPTAPPPPQFAIKFNSSYLCEQQGIYKVIINAKSGRAFAGGLTFAFFDQGGTLLQDGAGKNLIGVTKGDINVSIGSNCRSEASFESPNSSNGELDVGDAVRAGNNPIILRFVKSADDLTPISDNLSINFGNGGQYWVYTNTQ